MEADTPSALSNQAAAGLAIQTICERRMGLAFAYRLAMRDALGDAGRAHVRRLGSSKAEVTGLFVEPRLRGQGLGAALLKAAARIAGQAGVRELELSAQDDGRGSLDRWYRRLGFRETGRDHQGRRRFKGAVGPLLAAIDEEAG